MDLLPDWMRTCRQHTSQNTSFRVTLGNLAQDRCLKPFQARDSAIQFFFHPDQCKKLSHHLKEQTRSICILGCRARLEERRIVRPSLVQVQKISLPPVPAVKGFITENNFLILGVESKKLNLMSHASITRRKQWGSSAAVLPYLLCCCVRCVHAAQCTKLLSVCGKQSSYNQGYAQSAGIRNAKENAQGYKKGTGLR
ncbi:hypothetical protein EK904_010531 [Melospiza melodia maxima]|nr:hypothetical protein EK904_010531 [Melospiza melodia maxima]